MITVNKTKAISLAIALAASSQTFADVPVYSRTTIDSAAIGAAFIVSDNIVNILRPDLVTTTFGQFQYGPYGPIIPAAGTVSIYSNTSNKLFNGPLDQWEKIDVVTLADGITFPNRPHVDFINLDLRKDIIVPGGYFFDAYTGKNRGSLTWWENKGKNNPWVRHDLITASPFSYHSAALEDMDGDGIRDIVTVAENAGSPSVSTDDIIELQMLKGKWSIENGKLVRGFEPAVKIADGGGGLIEAYDVNSDGRMDIVCPQFFGPTAGQPFVPAVARNETVASYVWFENMGNGTYARHAIGTNQGPGFMIKPVKNLRGDGITRWIATNHTNKNIAFPPYALYPEPAVYEFTPGIDPRQPWDVRQLSAPGSFPVTGGPGQAAPGAASAGDLNGDGRLDIAVSGDGSRAVYWLEQQADGTFTTNQLPNSVAYGQSGGPVISDLNYDGKKEIVFGSFDQNDFSIWSR